MTRAPSDLIREVTQRSDPGRALTAIHALRATLDELEADHVNRALEAGWAWSAIARSLGVSKQAAHRKHARRARAGRSGGADGARERLVVTGRARRSVQLAKREAEAAGHAEIDPEHLLLGVLTDPEGVAHRAAESLGLTLDAARGEVRALRKQPPVDASAGAGERRVSARSRKVFEQALREAVALGHDYLGPEHILLALLRDTRGSTVRILTSHGVRPAALRARIGDLSE